MPEMMNLELLVSFIHCTSFGQKSTSLATSWTSTQFVVPKAFRHVAPFQVFLRSIGKYAVSIANELVKLSSRSVLRPSEDTRAKAVLTVKCLLDRTLENADRDRTMFIAAQVIADFEELWQNPFGDISLVCPGNGASWFLGTYRRGLPATKRKHEVTTDTVIYASIVRDLRE
jgi:hypothetical protein